MSSPKPASVGAARCNSADELLVPTSLPPAPVEAVDYNSVDELLASTRQGALAPLSGNYLVGLAKGKGRLVRRQDLPKEAFFVPSEAALRQAEAHYRSKFFIALSYRWLAKDHPDPSAFHLRIVAFVLQKHLDQWRRFGVDDVSMFWDFGSLHQKHRDERQEVLFKTGLKSSNIWYGSTQSTVWLQPCLPPGFVGATYQQSGWCFVEASISSAVKEGDSRWDLGRLEIDGEGNVLGKINHFSSLKDKCVAERLPPLLPTKVKDLLTHEKKFTSKGDVKVVAKLYQTFFEAVTSTTEQLVFSGVRWSAIHLRDFVEVLPSFTKLRSLSLAQNFLDDDGATILSSYLKANNSITHISLYNNFIEDGGANALAESLKANNSITRICLTQNNIGDGGAIALAESLKANNSITEIELSLNSIGDGGAIALAESLKVNGAVTMIQLFNNKIGDAGAVALAESLKENTTFKNLDVRWNKIGEKGKAALEEMKKVRGDIEIDV